jgi:hypothetical protein
VKKKARISNSTIGRERAEGNDFLPFFPPSSPIAALERSLRLCMKKFRFLGKNAPIFFLV